MTWGRWSGLVALGGQWLRGCTVCYRGSLGIVGLGASRVAPVSFACYLPAEVALGSCGWCMALYNHVGSEGSSVEPQNSTRRHTATASCRSACNAVHVRTHVWMGMHAYGAFPLSTITCRPSSHSPTMWCTGDPWAVDTAYVCRRTGTCKHYTTERLAHSAGVAPITAVRRALPEAVQPPTT